MLEGLLLSLKLVQQGDGPDQREILQVVTAAPGLVILETELIRIPASWSARTRAAWSPPSGGSCSSQVVGIRSRLGGRQVRAFAVQAYRDPFCRWSANASACSALMLGFHASRAYSSRSSNCLVISGISHWLKVMSMDC